MPHAQAADGAPLVRRGLGLAGLEVQGADAEGDAAQKIGIDVAVVDGGEAEAGVDQARDVDLAEAHALAGGNLFLIAAPDFADLDAGVGDGVRVGGEGGVEQHGHGFWVAVTGR